MAVPNSPPRETADVSVKLDHSFNRIRRGGSSTVACELRHPGLNRSVVLEVSISVPDDPKLSELEVAVLQELAKILRDWENALAHDGIVLR